MVKFTYDIKFKETVTNLLFYLQCVLFEAPKRRSKTKAGCPKSNIFRKRIWNFDWTCKIIQLQFISFDQLENTTFPWSIMLRLHVLPPTRVSAEFWRQRYGNTSCELVTGASSVVLYLPRHHVVSPTWLQKCLMMDWWMIISPFERSRRAVELNARMCLSLV